MGWTKVFDGPEAARVNKWLAHEGVCSRREAEALLAAGQVTIDGETATAPGVKIHPGQRLALVGGAAPVGATYVLNKPVGYVSAQPEPGQIPAARLLTSANLHGPALPAPSREARLAPLGRLDQDSRGLLLLSEDGVLAKAVIGPHSDLDKEYLVTVTGAIDAGKLSLLRHGLSLDGRVLKPAQVTPLGAGRLRFVLREGRKRQIRRMCAAVGLDVSDLARVRIGPLSLGDLPEGRWRALTGGERAALLGR